jgi:hypothetical protein
MSPISLRSCTDFVGRPVRGIPGGFVVHQHLDVSGLLRGGFDRAGVLHVHCERFLHHHIHALGGAAFHHGAVLEGAGENRHGLHGRAGDQVVQAAMEQGRVELETFRIDFHQFRIRFTTPTNSTSFRPSNCGKKPNA